MSSPIHHPMLVSVFIDILVTIIVDKFKGRLDLSIGGVTWRNFIEFPIWVVVLVFIFLRFCRQVMASHWLELAKSYRRPMPMRRPLTRINTSPRVWSTSVNERDITSATPDTTTRRNFVV